MSDEKIDNQKIIQSNLIRSRIKELLNNLLSGDISDAAVIRRDGLIIEAIEKIKNNINWKGISINAAHVINFSETLSNEIYMGDFETSVIETDYQRIVLSKINNICFLITIIAKKQNYTLEMLKISETSKKLRELLS
ncbi:MAG: hypothetical protein QXJ06_03250 [Candidatus Aenigmatarchaeota archaeon]